MNEIATLPAIIARHIEAVDGCWIWTGARDRDGYGSVFFKKNGTPAHRRVYSLLIGDIPPGLHIDHLCRIKACVNPAHLEPVTLAENNRRKEERLGIGRYAQHCVNGHEFNETNTYRPPDGRRCCRRCNAAAAARLRVRRQRSVS